MDFNILSWLIWTPVLGAILIVILPKNRMDLILITIFKDFNLWKNLLGFLHLI